MPLDPQALGAALNEKLHLHSALCRREVSAYLKAIESGDDVVVACTQEKRLFSELAEHSQSAVSPIRFVNIREVGGWSKDARAASPSWPRCWLLPTCQNPNRFPLSLTRAMDVC